MNEETFIAAIAEDPVEPAHWSALADWLQERGDPRGELLALTRKLLEPVVDYRYLLEERLQGLLVRGVRPCWPALTNSIGMKLAWIPAGIFRMGSLGAEEGHQHYEGPQHEVTITRPFYLGVYPVTQEQYEQVMGVNPSCFSPQGPGSARMGDLDTRDFPVECVSWQDAQDFCRRLSQREEEWQRGRVYRLPTEAEWEYACRGGRSSSTPFCFGECLSSALANCNGHHPYGFAPVGPYLERTTVVGSYPANAFGLYDVHGNVWEWCADWFANHYYSQSPRADPPGPPAGEGRIIRGGSWGAHAEECRSARRGWLVPGSRGEPIGFRVAMTVAAGV